jgi:hypothetical protein
MVGILQETRGSHRQYKHTVKSGLVTVAGKLSDDLAPGTLNSILKQAQLKEDIKNSEETPQTEEKKQEEEK